MPKTPDTDTLIPTARTFYAALAADNTKAWWDANRGTYDKTLKPGAQALLDDLTGPLGDLAGMPLKAKLFRPHRDVRFSKDKTPYNTHLHMMWEVQTGDRQNPVFFFGIDVDRTFVGVGVMGFEKDVLEDWRKLLDLDGPRMAGAMAQTEAAGFSLWEPELKRVPTPYPQDHPQARFLRMKGLVASREVAEGAAPLPDRLMQTYRDGMPVMSLLLSLV